jgi:hypothetical protein
MERTRDYRFLQVPTVIAFLLLVAVAGCLEQGTIPPAALPSPASTPVPVPPVHPPKPFNSFSLYEFQKILAPNITLALPTYLPDGFFFNTGSAPWASLDSPMNEGVYSVTYTRGQDERMTLSGQSRNATTCPDGPEYRPTEGNKTRTQRAGSNELTWGRNGWCFTLSGILSRTEMEKIAASVVPVPYREGVLPPYEYQPPEHPLIRNYTFDRTATAQGITITFETLRCMPDACTAEIRLGVASPPAFFAPPGVTAPPVSPEPHAEWRVDGGRPLLKMPGSGGYRPEGETTLIFWKIEPLPEDSRELEVNFSRVTGIAGPWLITVPLDDSTVITHPAISYRGDQ